MRAIVILILLFIAWGSHAATVTNDAVVGTLCSDGLVYSAGCPSTSPTYIVDSTAANNLGDGKSWATRWNTISDVNAGVSQEGADVCLMTGSRWSEKLTIDWSGASDGSDNVIVQSCYRDTSNSDAVTPYSSGSGNGRGTKAGLGYETESCFASITCGAIYDSPPSGGSTTSGQISITSPRHDIQVLDVKVEYVAGIGVNVVGAGSNVGSMGSIARIRLAGLDVYATGRQGVRFANGAQDFILENSTVAEEGQCLVQWRANATGPCSGACCGGSVLIQNYSSRGLIENNTVSRAIGEGIGHNNNVEAVITRGNRIGNTRSAILYCERCGHIDGLPAIPVVLESNILWGSEPAQGDFGNGYPSFAAKSGGSGGTVVLETGSSNANAIYRNNLMASGGDWGNATRDPLAEAGDVVKLQARHYGNSIGNVEATVTINGGRDSDGDGVEFYAARSNIYNNPASTAAEVCSKTSWTTGFTGDFGYNVRAVNPSSTFCLATDGSERLGDARFATTLATLNTRNYANPPTMADFALLAGSPALNSGDPGLDNQTCAALADYGTFIRPYMDYPFVPNETTWNKCLAIDFDGTARNDLTPDRGAIEQ